MITMCIEGVRDSFPARRDFTALAISIFVDRDENERQLRPQSRQPKLYRGRRREIAERPASESSMDDRILLRVRDNARQGIVDTLHKLKIQIFAMMSVPLAGFGEFVIGFGSEPNYHSRQRDFMNSALISSHVRP